jgi:CBS domain-containing protein
MKSFEARKLMTHDVVTAPPDLPLMAVARLLATHAISAVPVVGADGAVLGIVTEADLIRRLASRLERPASCFTSPLTYPSETEKHSPRTHGFVAREVMTAQVVTVSPEASASEVAALLEQHGIRRVLVMEDDRLCGVISRTDLLRVLVAPAVQTADMSDERIRRDVIASMQRESWAYTLHTSVEVKAGVVEFRGFSSDNAAQRSLRVLAEQVPGVRRVADLTQALPPYLYDYI